MTEYTFTPPEPVLGQEAETHYINVLNAHQMFALEMFSAEGLPIPTTMANVAAAAMAGLISNGHKDLVFHILTAFTDMLQKGEVDGEIFMNGGEVNSNLKTGADQ